jgi:hypothetical protein
MGTTPDVDDLDRADQDQRVLLDPGGEDVGQRNQLADGVDVDRLDQYVGVLFHRPGPEWYRSSTPIREYSDVDHSLSFPWCRLPGRWGGCEDPVQFAVRVLLKCLLHRAQRGPQP